MDSSIDPNEKANPVGLSINNFGVISHTFRDINHSGQQRSAAGFSLIDFQQSALDSPSSNALNPLASSLIPVPPPMPNRNQNVVNPR